MNKYFGFRFRRKGAMENFNHWIEDWLFNSTEAEGSRKNYERYINNLNKFCKERGKNLFEIVEEYRKSRKSGYQTEMDFVESWQDLIRTYSTHIKKSDYTPLTQKNYLSGAKSYFSYYKIPIDVDLPKRVYVKYHNRDLTKEHIRKILSKASQRDRTIFLLMAESGLRIGTAIHIKYWHIKEDFEQGKVPLRIITPSESLKDHVGDRWSFIGEDGEKALRQYLQPRMPLKDQDYIFTSRKPEKMKGKQFTTASISTIFRRIVNALKLENSTQFIHGKPHHLRLHGLRKYFRNYMRCDPSYREFWMGHSLGVDSHYVSRDPEFHRKEYTKGYEQLRVLEQAIPIATERSIEELKKNLTLVNEKLLEKDKEIELLKQQVVPIAKLLEKLTSKYGVGELVLKKKSTGELDTKWNALIEVPSESEEGKVKKKSKAKKLQE